MNNPTKMEILDLAKQCQLGEDFDISWVGSAKCFMYYGQKKEIIAETSNQVFNKLRDFLEDLAEGYNPEASFNFYPHNERYWDNVCARESVR